MKNKVKYNVFIILILVGIVAMCGCENNRRNGGYTNSPPIVNQPEYFDGHEVVYDNYGSSYVNIGGELIALVIYKNLLNRYGHNNVVYHYRDVPRVKYDRSSYSSSLSKKPVKLTFNKTNAASVDNTNKYPKSKLNSQTSVSNNPFRKKIQSISPTKSSSSSKPSTNPFRKKQ